MVVAFVVHRFIVSPRQQNKRNGSRIQGFMIGYGFIIPFLLLYPLALLDALGLKNITLMVCICGALPNLLLLRVVEAMHDTLPSFATESRGNLVLYYAGTLQVLMDEETGRPVPLTTSIFVTKAMRFLYIFLQTGFLFSLLIPCEYHIAPQRQIGSFLDLFYWGNLFNAYMVALLTSSILDGGASGLGILTSICTGMAMQSFSDFPMSRSSSPSDFWGNRWDRPVASGLKRGAFVPMRKCGLSRHASAILTFLVSGLIHEYMLFLMTKRQGTIGFRSSSSSSSNNSNNVTPEAYAPNYGNQIFFFLWNGVVLLLERALEGSPIIQWTSKHLPQPLKTALVLLTVLPVAHLFTDEYIRSSFYGDTAFAFPLISLHRLEGPSS
ncbi:unnamed protein product [Cylindrotheca closterium]|uniref:Wax synthase domain-containing protein n=1 Tax=Cylindrotheca closterium TaxID=2856 RepID=A0AAD2CS48_9STRA|nr:unnamed protein product [Cylindrotheca closterium]